jgi:putative acetyltransferase
MIRKFQKCDLEDVLDIWLEASIIAHDFIKSNYWISEISNMRYIYIPNSETYVYENENGICGFFSLHEKTLAAIFVKPNQQGKGIGSKLLKKAKELRKSLILAVYKENSKSVLFYRKAGFRFVKERIDENTGHPELIMQWP